MDVFYRDAYATAISLHDYNFSIIGIGKMAFRGINKSENNDHMTPNKHFLSNTTNFRFPVA